jgi:hypothetical protein
MRLAAVRPDDVDHQPQRRNSVVIGRAPQFN